MRRSFGLLSIVLAISVSFKAAHAQSATGNEAILERLDRLEKQNQELLRQVQELRTALGVKDPAKAAAEPTPPTQSLEDRQAVSENRIEELAQSKVESSQHFPIRLTGTALFNVFSNGAFNGGNQNPTVASDEAGPHNTGASFRQTTLGLLFQDPQSFLGGSVSGSLYMDFFGGSGDSLNDFFRLRTATLQLDWTNTTFAVGQDKPIVSQREPNSLAQVGVSPLTAAGNPWLWQPQARVEQRFVVSPHTSITATAGIFQTAETNQYDDYIKTAVEKSRPAFETRVNFKHDFGAARVFEIAPVFHVSSSHLEDRFVPSRLYGFDFFLRPIRKVEVTGFLFRGENFANLGALGGISELTPGNPIPVHGSGGWLQFRYLATRKLSFGVYGGQQDNRDRDLPSGQIGKNQYYAGNVMYLLAPNVTAAFEAGEALTNYITLGNRINQHHDLALTYSF